MIIRAIAMSRPTVSILVALAVFGAFGCGDEDDPPAPEPAPQPRGIAPPGRLAGSYSLDGRERRVRLTVTPTLVTRKRRNDYVVVPRGRAAVQVDLRLDDSGRDRFDLRLASFAAVDSDGRRVRESFRLPERRLEPGDPRSPRLVSVGFLLRRPSTLAQLRMSSIAPELPVRLRWRIAEAG
jgi:hypothetical protein